MGDSSNLLDSVSRKGLVLEIGAGRRLSCNMRRHLSPRTVGIITRSLPLRGNMHKLMDGAVCYFESSIDSGLERARSAFQRGDVAFLPSAGSICFFLRDAHMQRQLTPLGRLDGDLGLLESAGPGTVLSLLQNDECGHDAD